jgi:hypothetical protein
MLVLQALHTSTAADELMITSPVCQYLVES